MLIVSGVGNQAFSPHRLLPTPPKSCERLSYCNCHTCTHATSRLYTSGSCNCDDLFRRRGRLEHVPRRRRGHRERADNLTCQDGEEVQAVLVTSVGCWERDQESGAWIEGRYCFLLGEGDTILAFFLESLCYVHGNLTIGCNNRCAARYPLDAMYKDITLTPLVR